VWSHKNLLRINRKLVCKKDPFLGPFFGFVVKSLMLKFIFLILLSPSLYASTVLMIGDSHTVGPFGWYVDQNMRDAGHTMATYGSCGSVARWWVNGGNRSSCGYYGRNTEGSRLELTQTPKLETLLNTVRPDIVFMQFGGNYVHINDSEITRDIKSMISIVRNFGAQCLFITNPDGRNNRHLSPRVIKLMKEAVGSDCAFFDSRTVTRYPETGGDGIHYWFNAGLPLARKWANGVTEFFDQNF
jgi:hypothetical protein